MKYTAVISYKVVSSFSVEADSFGEALQKYQQQCRAGELKFSNSTPDKETFTLLGLVEDGWVDRLAELLVFWKH